MSEPTGIPLDRPRWSIPTELADAIALLVSLRVAFGLFALYLWWAGGLPGPCHFELARNGWLTIPPLADEGTAFPLVGVWQRWDACWYTKIATFGYEAGENSANFWPLFPILSGLAGMVLGGAVALAGLIVSGIAYVAAMTGLHRLVARDVSAVVAERTVLLISVFPAAFFFFAPFTEALFLALAVWAVLAARERRWALVFVTAGLASLTRIQGVFLVLPLGWEALHASGLLEWRPGRPVVSLLRAGLPGGLAAAAPLVGFGGFIAWTAAAVGSTPLDTQSIWGGLNFSAPWDVASASWTWAVEHDDPLQALNLVLLGFFGAAVVVGLRRLPFAYSLYAIPQVALLATRIQPTPLTSTSRYLLVVFPVFALLAMIPNRQVRTGWLVTSILFLGILLSAFLHGDYVA